ncbi:Uncharacterised protein [Yersinia pseudotuberculosis]|nr:Uncharacterised protein [Yersinia pseudotuberculosis]
MQINNAGLRQETAGQADYVDLFLSFIMDMV